MSTHFKFWTTGTLLIVICCIGWSVRSYNLTIWPRDGATFDEYAWTWLGMSIIDTGVPMSWSRHPQYKLQSNFVAPTRAQFVLSTPYLEHPPLFGLIAGICAKSMGAKSFATVTLSQMRPLSLWLGIVSIVMVYLLAETVFGKKVGLLASLIYALIPTISVGSRIVENENFFIPFFLLLLWLAEKYLLLVSRGKKSSLNKTTWTPYGIPILFLSFLLPLAKVPWIAAPIVVIGLFTFHKRYKDALSIFLMCVLSIGLYVLWGYRWDWGVFIGLMKLQTARYDMTFDGFLALVSNPLVTDRIYTDGWIFFGWIAMVLMLVNEKVNKNAVSFGFLAYLGMYLFAIPNEAGHGWYRYPLYPFLAITIAWSIKEYLIDQPFFSFGFSVLVGLPLLQHLLVPKIGFSYIIYRLYLFVAAIPLLPLVSERPWVKFISRLCSIILFVGILYLSYKAGLRYNEQ